MIIESTEYKYELRLQYSKCTHGVIRDLTMVCLQGSLTQSQLRIVQVLICLEQWFKRCCVHESIWTWFARDWCASNRRVIVELFYTFQVGRWNVHWLFITAVERTFKRLLTLLYLFLIWGASISLSWTQTKIRLNSSQNLSNLLLHLF